MRIESGGGEMRQSAHAAHMLRHGTSGFVSLNWLVFGRRQVYPIWPCRVRPVVREPLPDNQGRFS